MPTSRPILALVVPGFSDLFSSGASLPALERLAAYGGLTRSATTPELNSWQGELLQALRLGDARQYSSAPLTWLGMSESVPTHAVTDSLSSSTGYSAGTWVHADPVIHAISANGLTMALCGSWNSATLVEVTSLVREHLALSNMQWHVSADRSFVEFPQVLAVHTISARQATHGELQEALPTGPDAKVLRRVMAELQMLLHEKLPGQNAPNAVWLWGAGQMPQLTRQELPPVWTNDAYTRGIYRAHTAEDRCSALDQSSTFDELDPILGRAADSQLIAVCRDRSLESLETQWFVPALQALHSGRLQAVSIYLDGWQLHARRSFVRRFFSRRRPLTEWMN